jgi:hypothetical protein
MIKFIEFLINGIFLIFYTRIKSLKILKHNGINILDYPENSWSLVPFPNQKGSIFNFDNLSTCNRHSFIFDESFLKAKEFAENRWKINESQVRDISWRLHVMLWAIDCALSKLNEGDIFVECGTGKGYMASAICDFYKWGFDKPDFYLIDSFLKTMPNEFGNQVENGNELFVYADGDCEVRDYFSKYESVFILTGLIPRILTSLPDKPIRFIHIDLNSKIAEASVLENLVSKFQQGTVILFDDFGGPGGSEQALFHEEFAKTNNKYLLQIPTGQGLIIW